MRSHLSITAKKDELPPKPAAEPYQYIKELENKEIQVQVEELEAKGPFLMFCGTYRAIETSTASESQSRFCRLPFGSAAYRREKWRIFPRHFGALYQQTSG